MPRELLPLQTADLSSFAKSLAQQLALVPHPPGHQSLLNMLARAAGHRNLQSLRARRPEARPVPAEVRSLPPITAAARKALTQFDARGVLERWPHKHSVQRLALWVLWTHFEARRVYTERQVNALLNAWHVYGDPATLRRELVGMKLLARKSDCSEYRKLAARPNAEVRTLIQAWRRAAI
ncbi:MAG: DUF2087 domain-containing protein [Rhizobiales bacterium]|nr:DUF2087 domain-containing protein [Rhizobacter sp.]